MFSYLTLQIGYNKGSDQTVQMCRLICTFDVHILRKHFFRDMVHILRMFYYLSSITRSFICLRGVLSAIYKREHHSKKYVSISTLKF